jgi:hypothetical protein
MEARLPGTGPERTSYWSFFAFYEPDGNAWLVQEATTRLPGRGLTRHPGSWPAKPPRTSPGVGVPLTMGQGARAAKERETVGPPTPRHPRDH